MQLAQPLFILFRMSLETGMLPDDWKIAQISPIFKKGSMQAGQLQTREPNSHNLQDTGEAGTTKYHRSPGAE